MTDPAESCPQYVIEMRGQVLPTLSNGEPALRLISIEGTEALSCPFRYTLDCVTPNYPEQFDELANLDLARMIGNELTVLIGIDALTSDGVGPRAVRQVSGVITEASFQGAGDRYCRYRLVIRPWLHFAEHRTDYRIFQRQTVVEIVRSVLSRYGWPCQLRLAARYPELVYQVQYGETDFAFVQRLTQEYGIYWFFEHANDTHLLVLADAPSAHHPSPFVRGGKLPYHPDASSTHQEYVNAFHVSGRLHAARWASGDFNFETPHASLGVEAKAADGHDRDPLQQYVWPGDHADAEQGHRFAEVRMQEILARNERHHGSGPMRSIVCGTTFALEHHPHTRANREYLVTEASFEARATAGASGTGHCNVACSFVVQPSGMPFRPQRDVPRPKTTGPQTAIVTGPAGQEIWTDQYGRVKIKFHWDRAPERDDNSSCWVRVAFPWAAGRYGSVAIPRIGSEVVVDFENGDPDRPIVIGCVYNAANMTPWPLPRNATQSGILTRSTPGGQYEMANAIRFEDQAGCEQLWIHAQRDLLTEVERDEVHAVEANRTRSTAANDTTNIGGVRVINVQGAEQHVVNGAQQTTINGGHTLTVNGGQAVAVNGTQSLSASANVSITAAAQMSFICGASSIVMDSGGTVTITGVNVSVAAAATLVTVAPLTNLKTL
ncbi:type VI secretion system Vgr family protein [Paraburkholderia tagetis]|uniref:Type VI secretion system tip protein VgrG n=1 Tax=Paraburkholderia tagetis TaxID=2913261 RepID=A0A9X1UKS6_9BURK|nr:type VI secretion system tip protein TssI/VgrG [Paraburkholderia tagetis]MCG5075671.1 type VI secretion system tip protein VgrG [Paraburkholderia tagetis]